MAECYALLEAFRLKERFHGQKVCFELDCEMLFDLMMKDSVVGCEWQSQFPVSELLQLKSSMEDICFSLESRQGNKPADYLVGLAKKGMNHDAIG